MTKELNRRQTIYMLIRLELEDELENLLKDKWEITDDKSYDPIRSESDDEAYPYVVLRNGEFYDAISYNFKRDIFTEGDRQ